jgi:hypothetical protein
MTGNIRMNGRNDDADLEIPISGPRTKGEISVAGNQQLGPGSKQSMEIKVDGDEHAISLLAGGDKSGPPSSSAPKDSDP